MIYAFLFFALGLGTSCQSISETYVANILFKNYSTQFRPVRNGLKPLQIIARGFRMYGINRFDHELGFIVIHGYFKFVFLSFYFVTTHLHMQVLGVER